MRDPQRNLLYVNPPRGCELLPRLQSAGWQPYPVRNADELHKCRQSMNCDIGLIQLEERTDLDHAAFMKDFLNGDGTDWIAILPREITQVPQVRRLIAENCFDFHTLPVDNNRVLTMLGHAYGMARLRRQELRNNEVFSDEEEMVGCSPPMTALFRNVRKVAGNDAPVLLTGESGTGKELTARAIHERSIRAAGPFVAINCGAIPPNLIQSEMFGYERGAFTGATQRKLGRIELASGGTLLLDEIGDLPLELQANLLRFLQDGKIDRVGGQAPVAVDVRIIAATNVDLDKAIAEGRFRGDLYHRLGVLCLNIPPLRERGEDIELLARHFFEHFSGEKRRSLRGFSREALDAIRAHDWPGNVRELINRVRRAMVMCEGRQINSQDMGLESTRAAKRVITIDEARDRAEQNAIQQALGHNPNNLARAARDLGVSRVTLYRLLEKHRLREGSNKHGTAGGN